MGTPRIRARPRRGAEGRRGASSLRLRFGLLGSSLRRWASLWRLPGLGARVTGGMLWKIRSRCYVQKQRGVEHHQACRGHCLLEDILVSVLMLLVSVTTIAEGKREVWEYWGGSCLCAYMCEFCS